MLKLSELPAPCCCAKPLIRWEPVSVGDLLSFYAHVLRVGRTSVTVRVEVYAERNPADLYVVKVTEAKVTYVAIDRQGQPRLLPV